MYDGQFCFPAKRREKCPKCFHMKVGEACRGGNLGKSAFLATHGVLNTNNLFDSLTDNTSATL